VLPTDGNQLRILRKINFEVLISKQGKVIETKHQFYDVLLFEVYELT
jgi:hypothetical protein